MSSTMEEARERAGQIDVDVLRSQFNEIVAQEKRSMAQFATETGVQYSTLHAWAKSTYKGNNLRIAKQINAWLITRAARQKTAATTRSEPSFLMTPTASRVWDMLERAQTLPDMVMISGAAGIGKTKAVQAFVESGSNVWMLTAEPCHDTVNALLTELSEALGTEWQYRGAAMSRAIRKRLTGTKGLLIIDEAQHLTPRVRDQLRATVHDGAHIGIALVGGLEMTVQFQRELQQQKFAQLTRRIGLRIERKTPFKRDVEMLLDAWGVDLTDARELAMGIAMKPGANGQMTKTLRLAFELCDARGDETPTAEDIRTCWQQLGGNA
jgi:DNA transposition AAA+ family ATPase